MTTVIIDNGRLMPLDSVKTIFQKPVSYMAILILCALYTRERLA